MVTLDTDKKDMKREEQILRTYSELLAKKNKTKSEEK